MDLARSPRFNVIGQRDGPNETKARDEDRKMLCARWAKRVFGNRIFNAQVAIMGMLGTLMVGMTVGIWFHTSRHETSEVTKFALPLRDNLLQRTAARLVDLAESHYGALLLVANTLQSDLVTSTEIPKTGDLWSNNEVLIAMWPVMRTLDSIQSLNYVSNMEGDSVLLTGSSRGELWAYVQNNTRNNKPLKWYGRQNDSAIGKVKGPIVVFESIYGDLRLIPIYLGIKNRTNLALFVHEEVRPPGYPSLVMSVPLFGGGPHGNQTDGMLYLTMSLNELSNYIGALDLLGGFMYVTNNKGLVLAVTPGVSVTGRDFTTEMPILIPATKINHSVISMAAEYMEGQLGFQAMLEGPQHLSNVRIGAHRFYIESTSVKWNFFQAVVVIIVPRSSILGAVDKGLKTLAIFLFVLGSGTLIVAQVLVTLLTRYMSREGKLKKSLVKRQEAKELADACSSSARLFLANLSHDLRTPMSAVVNILGFIGACDMDAERMSLMDQVQGSASTLHALISSVLDISEMESGELQLNLAPLNIVEEIQILVDNFSVETESTGVDVLLDLPAGIPLVLADKMRIHQIFSNLLSNCVKFTTEGHVIIRGSVIIGPAKGDASTPDCQRSMGGVAFSRLVIDRSLPSNSSNGPSEPQQCDALEPTVHIAFEVEDTGRGISKEHKELLFENFVSAPDNHSRYGGTGVGLGIVRSLVNIMGGSIIAQEKEGCGASFSFNLSFPLILDGSDTLPFLSEPLPKKYDGLVTLAMPLGMQSSITSAWLIAHGLDLLPQETSWEQIPSAANSLWTLLHHRCFKERTGPSPESSSGIHQYVAESCSDTLAASSLRAIIIIDAHLTSELKDDFWGGTGLPKFLGRIQQCGTAGERGYKRVVAWACHPSMSVKARQALRLAGCYTIQKPLVASRLSALMAEIYMSLPPCSTSEEQLLPLSKAATTADFSEPGPDPFPTETGKVSADMPTIPKLPVRAAAITLQPEALPIQMPFGGRAKEAEAEDLSCSEIANKGTELQVEGARGEGERTWPDRPKRESGRLPSVPMGESKPFKGV